MLKHVIPLQMITTIPPVPTRSRLMLCLFSSVLMMTLTACQTSSQRSLALDDYLQQFIGQSAPQILAKLNLRQFGYQLAGPAEQSSNALNYRVLRPLSIPIPDASAVALGPAGTAPVRLQTGYTYYQDKHQSCQISFVLKQGIAAQVHYQGAAC